MHIEIKICGIFPKADNFYDLFGGGFSVTHFMLKHRAKHFKEFHFNEIRPGICDLIKKTINGDESNYQISQAEENVIVIRPISYVGLDTSLTMIGESGHVYTFYVRTEGANSRNTSDITVTIRVPGPLFAKNATENACILNEERTDYLEEAVLDSSKLNFKFSMSGDVRLDTSAINNVILTCPGIVS